MTGFGANRKTDFARALHERGFPQNISVEASDSAGLGANEPL
jgi:hypothetical protein